MKGDCSPMWVEEGWMGGEGGRKDGDHGWLRFDWNMEEGDTGGWVGNRERGVKGVRKLGVGGGGVECGWGGKMNGSR